MYSCLFTARSSKYQVEDPRPATNLLHLRYNLTGWLTDWLAFPGRTTLSGKKRSLKIWFRWTCVFIRSHSDGMQIQFHHPRNTCAKMTRNRHVLHFLCFVHACFRRRFHLYSGNTHAQLGIHVPWREQSRVLQTLPECLPVALVKPSGTRCLR